MGRPAKLHKHKIGEHYYWRARINGRERSFGRATTTRPTPDVLRRFAKQLEEAGRPVRTAAPRVLTQLISAWLRVHNTRDNGYRIVDLSRFARRHRILVPAVDDDILVRLLASIEGLYQPSTIRDRIRTAAKCLRWGIAQGWLNIDLRMPKLPKRVQAPRDVAPDELAAALSSLSTRSRQISQFIASTGCRPAEARMLKWSDVRLRDSVCVLRAHKTAAATGKPRTLFLTPPAMAILNSIESREGYVFRSRLGEPYTAGGLRAILRRKLPGLTPYRLRHSFAQVASEQIPEQDLARLMGHTSVETTRFYYAVKDEHARHIADRLSLPQIPPSEHRSPRRKARPTKKRSRQDSDSDPR